MYAYFCLPINSVSPSDEFAHLIVFPLYMWVCESHWCRYLFLSQTLHEGLSDAKKQAVHRINWMHSNDIEVWQGHKRCPSKISFFHVSISRCLGIKISTDNYEIQWGMIINSTRFWIDQINICIFFELLTLDICHVRFCIPCESADVDSHLRETVRFSIDSVDWYFLVCRLFA